MRISRKSKRKLTLLAAAGYFFAFALIAKGVFLYAHHHPPREALLFVDGTVRKTRLGGDGNATSLQIETARGTHRYSSYYGKVWPGMERIQPGDTVMVLAERDRMARNEMITGKHYYIWELIHRGQTVVAFEDVREQVQSSEASANRYINIIVGASAVLLLFVYLRRRQVT